MNEETKNSQENDKNNDFAELLSKIPNETSLNEKSEILKAMADTTRIKIVYLLKDKELCSCNIESALDKPQPTVSHHINILKKSKIINARKEGTWNYYSLTDPRIIKILDKIAFE